MWNLVKGVTCLILATAAGSASLYMNVTFGLTIGAGMALVFGLADCVKIIVPVMSAALGGWTMKRRLAWMTAVIMSIIAATSYLLEMQTTRLLESQMRTAMVADARSEIERMRKELSLISETSGMAALTKLEKEKRDAADREAKRGGCGSNCETLIGEADKLLERLGMAKRRDHLEARIAAAGQKADAVPVNAVGASNSLAALTGADQAQVAIWTGMIAAFLAIVLTEIVAMFSSDAGTLLARWWKDRKGKTRPKTNAPVLTDPIDKPEPAGKMTKDRALLTVQMMIWNSPGKVLVISRRALADHLDVSPSTFHDWFQDWLAQGKVKAEGNGASTKLTAAEAA
jgi:hypothetical protein